MFHRKYTVIDWVTLISFHHNRGPRERSVEMSPPSAGRYR